MTGLALRALIVEQVAEVEARERELAAYKAYFRDKLARVDAGKLRPGGWKIVRW